jgi:hypothetical protein
MAAEPSAKLASCKAASGVLCIVLPERTGQAVSMITRKPAGLSAARDGGSSSKVFCKRLLLATCLGLYSLLHQVGCAHPQNAWRNPGADVEKLEDIAKLLQKETEIMARQLERMQQAALLPQVREETLAAAAGAHAAYSQKDRRRDLHTLIDILEKRKAALRAEIDAYNRGLFLHPF